MNQVFVLLLAAHCYGDFLFQTKAMAESKGNGAVLLSHAAIHAFLAYLIVAQWGFWQIPLLVFVAHFGIDRIKLFFPATARTFIADQLAHLIALYGISLIVSGLSPENHVENLILPNRWLVAGAGFATAVLGSGYLIGLVAREMMDENPDLEPTLGSGLKGGGSRIGKLERSLIFMFLMIGHPAGIGFLIAAKSILRFEEAKQQNVSEYVLIGTLWSFGLAVGISWITLQLMPFF